MAEQLTERPPGVRREPSARRSRHLSGVGHKRAVMLPGSIDKLIRVFDPDTGRIEGATVIELICPTCAGAFRMSAAGLVFTALFISETRGRSLEEIEGLVHQV